MLSTQSKKLTPLARNLRKQNTWAEKLLWSWLRDRRFFAWMFPNFNFSHDSIANFYVPDFLKERQSQKVEIK